MYILSASGKDKDNHLISLPSISEAPLAMPISFTPKEVSSNPPLLIPNIPIDLNPVKFELANINIILIFTSIQESLDSNQIILQGKI